MPEQEPDSTLSQVQDAFQLLANETRLEILYALWTRPDWEATFTELKNAVGMGDSGQFQYHLNQLEGTFIQHTDDGYTHLAGGIALYRAMLGTITGPESIDPVPIDRSCDACHESLELVYENQVFYARCPECEASVLSSPFFRAGLANRTDEERLHAFDNWSRRSIDLLQNGVCPWCTSTVSHEFENSGPSNEGVRITHRCDRCAGFLETRPGENVLNHPAVTAFFYRLGQDISSRPHWTPDFCTNDDGVRVLSEDLWTIEQTIRYENEHLTLVIDDGMGVEVTDCSLESID